MTPTSATRAELPAPCRQRWQPLRAGLVDLFHYDREEFWFRDGHLLLRGNNGTGKSKVLALMLPFLLDGEITPYRVEPDGDGAKRMEWNLLLGGRHAERTGYTWLEFGRLDAEGKPSYLSIGAGLRAASGRSGVQSWFFVTEQRVGEELFLVGTGRAVVPRDRLRDALGDRGEVHDQATDYRRAVDERLFHLGAERYDSLVSLLIQLRQPQLSKRPDERRLSNALTEALAPLDQALLADVAEAFRSLDEERSELAVFGEARDTAATFLDDYRRYAQIAARRRCDEPREAQSRYEATGRQLGEARRAQDEAEAAITRSEAELEQVRDDLTVANAEQRALADSEQMRDAKRLQRLAEEADQLRARAERSADEADRAGSACERRRRRLDAAARRGEEAERVLLESRQAIAAAAGPAGIDDLGPTADGGYDRARTHIERRGQAVATVQALLDAEAGVARDVAHVRRRLADAEQRSEQARAELSSSQADRDDEADAFWRAAEFALTGAEEVVVADRDGALGALDAWVASLDRPDPARAALTAAADLARDRLAADRHGLVARRADLDGEREQLASEREALEAGEVRRPPVPHTRDEHARADRAGAPLWRLVDFADDLGDADRSGLEAAMESSGMLDAWVTPDGRLVDADDVVLVGTRPVSDQLTQLLRPAVDDGDARARLVSEDAVTRVLRSIAVGPAGDATSWVDTAGHWQLGVARGRWHKPSAEYVGAGARDRARRRRLEEIDARVAELDEAVVAVDAELEVVDRRRDRVTRDLTAYPADQQLRDAHARVVAAGGVLRSCDEVVAQLRVEGEQLASALARARTTVEEAAADLRLPPEEAGLGQVRQALATLESLLPPWSLAIERRADAAEQLSVAQVELDEAADARARAADAAGHDRQRAHAKRAEHDTLQGSAGAAVQELQRRLDGLRRRVEQLEAGRDRLIGRLREVEGKLGEARGKVAELERALADHDHRRRASVATLRRFAASGLLEVALPELDVPDPAQEWAPTPAVQLARRVEAELADVDAGERSWERANKQVTDRLQSLTEALSRSGGGASYRTSDDGLLVSAQWRGGQAGVPELVAGLSEELAERERVLSAREQEILENHLVDHVAAELQTLIGTAERQVAAMNEELAERPTSTGMTLRLVWEPVADGPEGLAAVRARLLRQDAAAWSAQDRQAIGRFLQARINQVRMEDEAGTWLEHLMAALNYRTWHRFSIQRFQDGRWRPATGPSSGGERVLAATMPLFAAASSYYRSGSAHAPRLVMLDEAFAGVDDDSRAKCLGLLATFDLDYVLTSEREWGCYPTVPGLSIAHLTRRDGIDAVLVSSWEWDGVHRERTERALPPLQMASDSGGELGLFS